MRHSLRHNADALLLAFAIVVVDDDDDIDGVDTNCK